MEAGIYSDRERNTSDTPLLEEVSRRKGKDWPVACHWQFTNSSIVLCFRCPDMSVQGLGGLGYQ